MKDKASTGVALVTGGGRGLGRAYARRLGGLGYAVAVIDRDLRSHRDVVGESMTAESTIAELEEAGVRTMGLEVSAADYQQMAAAVAEVEAKWGAVDVAVCNAGGGSADLGGGAGSELTRTRVDDVLERNLHTTIATCVAVLPGMRRRRSGSIITVSSQAGAIAQSDGGYADYGLAKAAVAMYTRYLAQEVGPEGVRVNCIAPGFVDTARVGAGIRKRGVESFTDQVALRRIGNVDDCADLIEFLASARSSFITGQVLPVDGGLLRGPS